MGEIKTLDFVPVILTKDRQFVKQWAKTWQIKPGAIMLLPDDAVLVKPPHQPSDSDNQVKGDIDG